MDKALTLQAAVAPDSEAPQVAAPTHHYERVVNGVTVRCFVVGILLSALIAFLNCYLLLVKSVSTVGGIQMPFGAVFALLFLILFINGPVRLLHRAAPILSKVIPVFSAPELLTIYVMSMFAGLVSTAGCDNQFMTYGPSLFYFHTPENKWAELLYRYVPSWFAPSWNGHTYSKDVIDPLFLGGVPWSKIPWSAWIPVLSGWSIFLLLQYSTLFFVSLLFRKQWIEREALAFPLVQLPLQMVEVEKNALRPTAGAFWLNGMMWLGFLLAFSMHFLTGMSINYPGFWPTVAVNQYNAIWISFPDAPWNALGTLRACLYLGGIGIAFLLTREVSFSFWFFFLFSKFQLVFAQMIGIPTVGLPNVGLSSQPAFLIYQGAGGWTMMALMLVWMARDYLKLVFVEAFGKNRTAEDEPFSARTMVFGFILSFAGLIAWSWFAGINVFMAIVFMGIFLLTSLALTRMVIEGGFLFPQAPYLALEWMTTAMFSAKAIGAQSLTSLTFVQSSCLMDIRTNVLPGFLHAMKIADELRLDRKGLRRMLIAAACAIVIALAVTFVTTLVELYGTGGLQCYGWFTTGAPKAGLTTAATYIKTQPTLDPNNLWWMLVGGLAVFLMMAARTRFLWFPLHPLGYIAASAYPMSQLWFSFFVGWLIKSLVMRYGGSETYSRMRPFMIGLILGNLTAMIFWMIVGFKTGTQVGYWCA